MKAVLTDSATRKRLAFDTLAFVIFCKSVRDFFHKIIQQFGGGVCEN